MYVSYFRSTKENAVTQYNPVGNSAKEIKHLQSATNRYIDRKNLLNFSNSYAIFSSVRLSFFALTFSHSQYDSYKNNLWDIVLTMALFCSFCSTLRFVKVIGLEYIIPILAKRISDGYGFRLYCVINITKVIDLYKRI